MREGFWNPLYLQPKFGKVFPLFTTCVLFLESGISLCGGARLVGAYTFLGQEWEWWWPFYEMDPVLSTLEVTGGGGSI